MASEEKLEAPSLTYLELRYVDGPRTVEIMAIVILLANNIVAIILLFKHNKYQISTFLLEPLAKKVCSVLLSVSIYITIRGIQKKRVFKKSRILHQFVRRIFVRIDIF